MARLGEEAESEREAVGREGVVVCVGCMRSEILRVQRQRVHPGDQESMESADMQQPAPKADIMDAIIASTGQLPRESDLDYTIKTTYRYCREKTFFHQNCSEVPGKVVKRPCVRFSRFDDKIFRQIFADKFCRKNEKSVFPGPCAAQQERDEDISKIYIILKYFIINEIINI